MITDLDHQMFAPAGVSFIKKIEEQLRRCPFAGPRHLYPPDVGNIERDFIARRFELVDGLSVTRIPDGLVVKQIREED